MCCLPTLFQVGIALFLYKWVRECRFACKVDALANFPIAFFISAMSSFTLLTLDLISLLLKPDRSKSSVRFSFSVETLWGGLRVWRNTSPEAFPADRVLLSIFRSRRSLPYNISNFRNCRVRFFNIQEGGGRFPPGSSRMSSPRRRGSPFVFRAPPLRALRRRPAKPCKASAAAMLAWLRPSRRGFCNARACKCNMLFTKKARNILAKDGPGSFDQPNGNNIVFFIKGEESPWLLFRQAENRGKGW